MNKKTEIHNEGQFAGNVDSPGAKVYVDRQQQILTSDVERALREHVRSPGVQEALELPLSPEEKSQVVGSRLAKVAGVAVDVATNFATKLIAEMAKGQ